MNPPVAPQVVYTEIGFDLWSQHRISHAQRLMATTDEKTLAIATQSGFGSVCRFYQAFKRITGQTPKTCANALRGKVRTPDPYA